MFRKILLPLDLDPKHHRAVDTAIALAKHADGEVTLLHVIESIEGLEAEEDKDFYEQLEAASRDVLKKFHEQLEHAGVRAHWEICYGKHSAEILRHIGEHEIDLIVLTSPRYDPDHPQAAAASLSWKLGVVSPCTVLLIKSAE